MISPAVRARTILATSPHVELGVLGSRDILPAHLVDPTGGILLRPWTGPCWDRLRAGEPCPTLDMIAVDVTAVPQPDRIRAVVRLRGRVELLTTPAHCQLQHHLGLRPGDAMARFAPDSVVLDLSSTQGQHTVGVPLADYAAAASDPLAGWEAMWISHLDSHHHQVLRELTRHHIPVRESDDVRVLLADSTGVTVRVYGSSQRDIHLAFGAPARCGRQAVAAFNALIQQVVPPRAPGAYPPHRRST